MFLFAILFLFSSKSNAQSYFTYDGSSFSVLLTCDNSNTRVTNVEFSHNSKWVPFEILDYSNLESTDGGGFAYTVRDGAGKKFLIDYYRTQDYIKVYNLETNEEWTLYRRAE